MTELSMQHIWKFVKDCDTLIIHFWSLSGFKPKSEPLSVYSLSGCFFLSACSSLELSQFPALMPQNLTVFLSLASPFFFFFFCSSLHTYAALPPLALFFPFSFLLSHLVTRPLERSVEFPLSQRRGQSEPHKDPQWTPSALSSLCSVTAQLHTHTHRHRNMR